MVADTEQNAVTHEPPDAAPMVPEEESPAAEPAADLAAIAEAGPRLPRATPQLSADSTMLSLALIILAFFIVLVAMSHPGNERSAAVIESVASAFATDRTELRPPRAGRGEQLGATATLDRLRRVLAADLDFAVPAVQRGGSVLSVTVPTNQLFVADTARLRPAAARLLDRVVVEAGTRPPGLDLNVEAELMTEGDGASREWAVARAAALGAAFARRGVSSAHLRAGVAPGPARRLRLVFKLGAREDIDAAAMGVPS